MLFKLKFVDQGKSCYAVILDRKNALGLYLCHMLTPFLLRTYVDGEKREKEGGGNKAYFCLATCNEACLVYMGILAIVPFN